MAIFNSCLSLPEGDENDQHFSSKFDPALADSLRCTTKLALHKTHMLLGEHDDLRVDMMTWLDPSSGP